MKTINILKTLCVGKQMSQRHISPRSVICKRCRHHRKTQMPLIEKGARTLETRCVHNNKPECLHICDTPNLKVGTFLESVNTNKCRSAKSTINTLFGCKCSFSVLSSTCLTNVFVLKNASRNCIAAKADMTEADYHEGICGNAVVADMQCFDGETSPKRKK